MKASDQFKKTIEAYIENQAEIDPLFAPCLEKEGKNIDDCCTYIMNWVQKSGCNGFTDAEIFGQALHYYQEDKIDIGKPINCKVAVNHEPDPVELTEEDRQEARQKAIDDLVAEERKKLIAKPEKAAAKQVPEVQQASLF